MSDFTRVVINTSLILGLLLLGVFYMRYRRRPVLAFSIKSVSKARKQERVIYTNAPMLLWEGHNVFYAVLGANSVFFSSHVRHEEDVELSRYHPDTVSKITLEVQNGRVIHYTYTVPKAVFTNPTDHMVWETKPIP